MPSSEKKKVKDLHLSSSVGDLNKLADPGLPVDRNANPLAYIKSADKVFLKAQTHDLEGDEENAYVFYMRFFNIISLIKKSNRYTEKKKHYDDLMGKTKIIKSIERAEALQKSLFKRYGKLKDQMEAKVKAEEEARKKEEEDKKKLELEKAKSSNGADSDSGFDSDLDSFLNGSGISSSVDVYQKLKVSHGSILMPKTSETTDGALIGGLEMPNFSTKPSLTNSVPFVSAQDLYGLLRDENASKVLILDCRPHAEFMQNRINRPSCINIPAELLDLGVSAGSIERRLREDTRKIWNRRGEKEFVILMDESTKAAEITPESRVQRLKDVIFTFDSHSSLKREPLFLDGGFHSWLWHYPSIALKPELPKVAPQPTAVTPVDLSSLDYPDLPTEKTSAPPAPQLPPGPTSLPNKNNFQYPILPSANLENDHGSFVKPVGTNDVSKVAPANYQEPLHLNGPGPQLGEQASAVAPAKVLTQVDKSGSLPADIPSVPQTQTEVPPPRSLDLRVSVVSNPPSSQPGAPLLTPSNPPFGLSGLQTSVSHTLVPKPAGSHVPASVPMTTVSHPQHQPSVPVSGPPTQLITEPSSLPSVQHAAASQPFSPSSLQGIQSVHPGISSPYPPRSNSTSPTHISSPGPGPSVSPVSRNQPVNVNSTSSMSSKIPSVSPPPTVSAAVPRLSQTTVPQQSPQPAVHSQNSGVIAPSIPGQMPHQVAQSVQPQVQPQVPPIGQMPPDGRQSSGQPLPSAMLPHQAASAPNPGVELRHNQHGGQTSPSINQVPSNHNVSGNSQYSPKNGNQMPGNSQVSPRDSTKQSGRELTQPADSVTPKPLQQPVSSKQSIYITTPGLPPGWERVDNGGKPFYKDHNTQTTHWEPPKGATTGSKTAAPQANVQKQSQPQIKRQSSVDKPTLRRSLSSPNIAKLLDQGSSGPKRPVVDRLSKPDSEQSSPSRPKINRSAKPLTAMQLDGFNPSYGGNGAALTGLRNLGNTCYMNSVVQCLSSVAPLAAFFISGAYMEDINRSSRDGTRGELAEKFSVLVRVLHSGQFKCVSPGEIKRTVGKFKSQFSGYDQQDSQELLAFLMDGLQEDLNKVKQKPYLRAPPDDLDPESAAKIAWENHKRRNESIMVELFDGLFMSTVKCMFCGKESRTFDAFSNLTLPLPSHINRCTLQHCLSLFTQPEKMAGDNKWFCPKCRQRREASKTIQIWRLPVILIVHLKRFQYEGMWRQKLQTNVSFPMSQLDMSNYVVGPRSAMRYNLHAVSNHYGTMHGGHYTAFAKSVYDKKWYKFDDQYVTEISPRDVVTSAGYLLFYTSFEFQPPKYSFKA